MVIQAHEKKGEFRQAVQFYEKVKLAWRDNDFKITAELLSFFNIGLEAVLEELGLAVKEAKQKESLLSPYVSINVSKNGQPAKADHHFKKLKMIL